MASEVIGRVMMSLLGDYDGRKKYTYLDAVLYKGSTYVCKVDARGIEPTDTEHWQLIAQKGDDASGGQSGSIGSNVLSMGAKGDGTTDDTEAIQKGLDQLKDSGGCLYFPKGKYKITHNLVTYSGIKLLGESKNSTWIIQSGTDYHIKATDNNFISLEELTFEGPGIDSTGGGGLEFLRSANANCEGFHFKNVTVQHCATAHGIGISVPITSTFENVKVLTCVGNGFDFYGGGTSVVMISCYAITCTQAGYNFNQLNYSTIISCATEVCGIGFYLNHSCNNVVLIGCGAEDAIKRSDAYKGVDYQVEGGVGNQLIGVYSRGNQYAGINLINASPEIRSYRQLGEFQYSIIGDKDSHPIITSESVAAKMQVSSVGGTLAIDTANTNTNKKPSEYPEGFSYEQKTTSAVGINRDSYADDAKSGTNGILTTKAVTIDKVKYARQSFALLDNPSPYTFERNGSDSEWQDWHGITTWN